jgi:Xaa-Pro dipeptidase
LFVAGNPEPFAPGLTLFAHMVALDSVWGTAMTLGRTYLTGDGAPKPLSRHGLDLVVR